ncbi:DUF488 family protein [Streptosporangium canum]|uniref:DUF488 family protein n=1 Tax=Streptosporangium canum TaxID=324952 RepID=UPI003430AD89
MLRTATIEVHGFGGEFFLHRLRPADVRLLLDVRRRRGVRGPEYAWANSRRLQAALAHVRIAYEHRPEFAPATELRRLRYAEDDRQGVGKRSRRELAAEHTHGGSPPLPFPGIPAVLSKNPTHIGYDGLKRPHLDGLTWIHLRPVLCSQTDMSA